MYFSDVFPICDLSASKFFGTFMIIISKGKRTEKQWLIFLWGVFCNLYVLHMQVAESNQYTKLNVFRKMLYCSLPIQNVYRILVCQI